MGLLLVAAAQLCFSFMNVTVELLNRSTDYPITTLQIVAIRMCITYVGSTSWMLFRKIPYPFFGPPEVRTLLIARGVSGFLGLFAVYYSLGYMTLSDSTTLTFLTPALTGLFAHLFLGETFTERELCAALSSLVGVIFITRPSVLFGHGEEDMSMDRVLSWTLGETHVALAVSLLGVTGAAAAYTIISAIGRRAHAIHMVAYLSGAGAIACILEMLYFRVPFVFPSSSRSFVYLIASGLLGGVGQTFLSVGLQGEKAGRGSLVMFLQIIFSGVVDRLTFAHPHRLPFMSFIGSVIILSASYWGTFYNLTRPSASSPISLSPSHGLDHHDLPLHSPKIDRPHHRHPFNSPTKPSRHPLSSPLSTAQSFAEKVAHTLGLASSGSSTILGLSVEKGTARGRGFGTPNSRPPSRGSSVHPPNGNGNGNGNASVGGTAVSSSVENVGANGDTTSSGSGRKSPRPFPKEGAVSGMERIS